MCRGFERRRFLGSGAVARCTSTTDAARQSFVGEIGQLRSFPSRSCIDTDWNAVVPLSFASFELGARKAGWGSCAAEKQHPVLLNHPKGSVSRRQRASRCVRMTCRSCALCHTAAGSISQTRATAEPGRSLGKRKKADEAQNASCRCCLARALSHFPHCSSVCCFSLALPWSFLLGWCFFPFSAPAPSCSSLEAEPFSGAPVGRDHRFREVRPTVWEGGSRPCLARRDLPQERTFPLTRHARLCRARIGLAELAELIVARQGRPKVHGRGSHVRVSRCIFPCAGLHNLRACIPTCRLCKWYGCRTNYSRYTTIPTEYTTPYSSRPVLLNLTVRPPLRR